MAANQPPPEAAILSVTAMPRDDLSIDFVMKMPQAEPLDPGLAFDNWINRVQNLPEEIRFMQDEIADKDRQYNECIRAIEERDSKIQKWIKSNDSLEPNAKEDQLRDQIRENYARADQLSQDKIALALKLQAVIDKHIRSFDVHIKLLYDRGEPGFTDPDEVPSLLHCSAANITTPSIRPANPHINTAAVSATPVPLNPAPNSSTSVTARFSTLPQFRHAQAQPQHAASAPATPTANIILNPPRESSAGPTAKRGPRVNVGGQANAPAAMSGLEKHASLGPETPKSGPSSNTVATVRAGSAGPRSSSVKAAASRASSRRGTQTLTGRKKATNKSTLLRVKKASARNSPASAADSDLSEADSISDDEAHGADFRSRAPSVVDGKDASTGQVFADAEDDDDEGSDNKKYCLCHNVSYGDMVACDNVKCPYEWFHWSCVGLKSGPNGTWYCPVCTERKKSR